MRCPERIFITALDEYLAREGASLLEDVSERHTCGRLALYVERQFESIGLKGFFADVEYNRKQNGEVKTIINQHARIIQITPDLIVHTRGERPYPHDNLIAVEVKKSNRPQNEKDADRDRLIAMTMNLNRVGRVNRHDGHPEHVCGYKAGVYVEIDIGQRKLHLEIYRWGRLHYEITRQIN